MVGVQVTLYARLLTALRAPRCAMAGSQNRSQFDRHHDPALNEAVVIADTVDLLGACLERFTTRRA